MSFWLRFGVEFFIDRDNMSDSSGGTTTLNVPPRVEGIPYDASLGSFTPNLLQMFAKQTEDPRPKLVKLRDEYTANLNKLKKLPCEQLFRDCQALGMKKNTTECPNMPKKCAAQRLRTNQHPACCTKRCFFI